MNERVFRCSPIFILGCALLMVLPSLAAADGGPRVSPQARAEFAAAAPPQAEGCRLCALAHQTCSATCLGFAEKGGIGECLTACDNAAATCTCDQAVGLRSEELVNFEWPSLAKAACHGTVSCQPNYPSCASWSAYSNCGDPTCTFGPRCGGRFCDENFFCWWEPGPAWRQPKERFRVCFDPYGNSCTEWQQTSTLTCADCLCPECW